MFSPDQYQLLDFGGGRKLERFGEFVLERPAPAVESLPMANPDVWRQPRATFRKTRAGGGVWKGVALPDHWIVRHGDLVFQLKPTPAGHIGLFPEQSANWEWISHRISKAGPGVRVLNLFAYTGGSTLAAAAAGAEVVHVDAAKNVVAWARRNAELSGMRDASIRWINEDARRFVERELKRGNRYHAVILDPPSYGHGPGGEAWKLERHLLSLIRMCGTLTEGQRLFVLATCHTPSFGAAEIQACLADGVVGNCQANTTAQPMSLRTDDGRSLPCGTKGLLIGGA